MTNLVFFLIFQKNKKYEEMLGNSSPFLTVCVPHFSVECFMNQCDKSSLPKLKILWKFPSNNYRNVIFGWTIPLKVNFYFKSWVICSFIIAVSWFNGPGINFTPREDYNRLDLFRPLSPGLPVPSCSLDPLPIKQVQLLQTSLWFVSSTCRATKEKIGHNTI